jgi:hypothetical protein
LFVSNILKYGIGITLGHQALWWPHPYYIGKFLIQMQEEVRIDVNRALRRRKKFFGISQDVGIVLMVIFTFSFSLVSFGVAPNFAAAIFATLFFTALFTLKDGMGEVLAKMRKPRHYTRGCFEYRSPLRTMRKHEKKAK